MKPPFCLYTLGAKHNHLSSTTYTKNNHDKYNQHRSAAPRSLCPHHPFFSSGLHFLRPQRHLRGADLFPAHIRNTSINESMRIAIDDWGDLSNRPFFVPPPVEATSPPCTVAITISCAAEPSKVPPQNQSNSVSPAVAPLSSTVTIQSSSHLAPSLRSRIQPFR